MNRPDITKLLRTTEKGIRMNIPQAADMLGLIGWVLHLEAALDLIRRGYADPKVIASDALGTSNAKSGAEPGAPEAKK